MEKNNEHLYSELSEDRKEFLLEQFIEYKCNESLNAKAEKTLMDILRELEKEFASNGRQIPYDSSRSKTLNSFLNKINDKLDKDEVLPYEDFHDIVGCRLVFLNLDDLYAFVDRIKELGKYQSDELPGEIQVIRRIDDGEYETTEIKNHKLFKMVEAKDYISNPKSSGYRSYHIIVDLPVIDESGIERIVKAEIQLRTIFMDIFSREEHKLGYKGSCSEEDKKELKMLSDKLYFYDVALNYMFKDYKSVTKEITPSEQMHIEDEYERIAKYYRIINGEMNSIIEGAIEGYNKKEDLLHKSCRIKPVESIRRKIFRRGLTFSARNILDEVKDVVGYKIVCTDRNIAKDFANYFLEYLKEHTSITDVIKDDRLDNPKNSGYRGYKMNLGFILHSFNGEKPVYSELLIRTMCMDAWALHDDKIYQSGNIKEDVFSQLRGLSNALKDVEDTLVDLKSRTNDDLEPEVKRDLATEIEQFRKEKKNKKRTIVLKP